MSFDKSPAVVDFHRVVMKQPDTKFSRQKRGSILAALLFLFYFITPAVHIALESCDSCHDADHCAICAPAAFTTVEGAVAPVAAPTPPVSLAEKSDTAPVVCLLSAPKIKAHSPRGPPEETLNPV